jgi:hypothetical protein
MSRFGVAPFSRPQQRAWLFVCSAATGLAVLHQVVFPASPPLAVPANPARLPHPWPAAEASMLLDKQPATMLQRSVAIGASQRFSLGDQWLLLTPLASWSEAGLDPAAITRAIPQLHLDQPGQLQPRRPNHQIAFGLIQGAPSYQTCLTRSGASAWTVPGLEGLTGRPHQDFLRTLIGGRIPSQPRPSYACLLVTTNHPEWLANPDGSDRLLRQLTTHTQWPW